MKITANVVQLQRLLWTLVACLMAAVVVAAGWFIWIEREQALQYAHEQASHFVSGAVSALNRSLMRFDIVISGAEHTLAFSAARGGKINTAMANQMLRAAALQTLQVRYLVVLGERDEVIASSHLPGERQELPLPQGFVHAVREQVTPALVVSAPVVSPVSYERMHYMARPIRLPDGAPAVAIAQVTAGTMALVLMQGVDPPGLEATLERGSGELLLSVPPMGNGEALLLQPPLESAPTSALDRARLSRQPAVSEAQPLLYDNLWVAASIDERQALAEWRGKRNVAVALALVFCAVLLAAAALVAMHLRHQHRARVQIARSQNMLNQAFDSMVSGFLVLDARHCVQSWNPRFIEFYPWLDGVIGRGVPFRALARAFAERSMPSGSEAEKQAWVAQRLALHAKPGGPHEQEHPTGRIVQITERSTADGGMVITYHDVTALRHASAEIENLAFYDVLTGLPNRRLLLDRLEQAQAMAQRSGMVGALLYLDLDNFKVLNDTQGHEMGDLLLQHVARRLKEVVGSSDTVSRLGGDEFVVMLPELSAQPHEAAAAARRIGEKVLQQLDEPFLLGLQHHRFACSVGATLYGHEPRAATDLLKQADIAMYQAKAQSGSMLCFFDPQMQTAIHHRAELEMDLQAALSRGQFELHYQPQFTLLGQMVGAEALLRWRNPRRGWVSPGEFIAVAEDSGLIMPIGLWVLRTACQQLAAWQSTPGLDHLTLSVNVSARQFRQPDFVSQVLSAIHDHGVPARLLELELTESLVIDNVEDSIAKMHALRSEGVRFALDDFGTGHSSLAYLTRLPLHQLKIDQSFVRNLGVRYSDDAIVQTIIGMATNLDLEVIAEGVETELQRDFLAAHGCGMYQGYLFARPMPAAHVSALALQRVDQAVALRAPPPPPSA